jgi:plasmid maintenance system antidote protein VapI
VKIQESQAGRSGVAALTQLYPVVAEELPVAGKDSMGERLEQVLRARNVRKIYPLALELEVNESCVSRWRRGGAISTDNAIKLCRVLDISLDWFLSGRGQMDQHKKRGISNQEYALIEGLRLLPDEARQSLLSLFEVVGSRLC